MRSPTPVSSLNDRPVVKTSRQKASREGTSRGLRDDLPSADVDDTMRLARTAMPVLGAAAIFLAICFWGTPRAGAMPFLLACLLTPAACAFAGAFAFADRASTPMSAVVARVLALLIGCAWGAVPLTLFAAGDEAHRLILVATIAGVLAVVSLLGPMISVCLLFGAPVAAGALGAVAFSGDPAAGPLSLLIVACVVFFGAGRAALQAVAADRSMELSRIPVAGLDPMRHAADDIEGRWSFELDDRGRMRNVSEALAAAAGVARLQFEGAPLKSLLLAWMPSASMSASARLLLDRVAARRAFDEDEVEIKTADGSLWWRFVGKPLHHVSGGFAGHRGACIDVTAAHRAEAQINVLTTRDALTGAVNREKLLTEMAEAGVASTRDGVRRAFVLLDLDGFKMINDGFGHAAGDTVLEQVAARLTSLAPPSAIVGRLGDDDFGVLCQAATVAAAEGLARHLIEGLAVAFPTAQGQVNLGATGGVAVMPDHGDDAFAILAKAEIALRRAKTNGRGRHRLFIAAYEEQLATRRGLEDDLTLALARHEFALHYQPLVDLATGRVTSFEALIRWISPTRGLVSPASFIPAAETMGLIVPIGRWVLAEACNEAARWDPAIGIAVNISPQHFRSPDFVQEVVTTLAVSGLHASRLEIEITEGVFLEQSDVAMENCAAPPRCSRRARRFRDRLFVFELSRQFPRRQDQDRPVLRAGSRAPPRKSRHCRGDPYLGQAAVDPRHGRRGRDDRPGVGPENAAL